MINFNKRSRKIDIKFVSQSGIIVSKKNSELIQFESSLEKDFVYLLEFDTEIHSYVDQPLAIPYRDEHNKMRIYYPDFLVKFHDEDLNDIIVEIKYEKDLVENAKKFTEKFESARKFCKNNSLTFCVLSEKEIRGDRITFLNNAKFLSRFRNISNYYQDKDQESKDIAMSLMVVNKLRQYNICTINALMIELESDCNSREELLYYIWFLIANNYIGCNLELTLSMDTYIWVT